MEEQKTLLQLISEKESELNKRLEAVAGEADGLISRALLASRAAAADAEAKGKQLAAERYRAGKALIDAETEQILKLRDQEVTAVRRKGEENLEAAVEFIYRAVAFH
jgi:hypothetical protein